MGIIRNLINVEGIAQESDFNIQPNDNIIKYSCVETLFIPSNKPEAKKINEINIKLQITDERILKSGIGKSLVLGGLKNYKVSYVENSPEATKCTACIQEPYITYLDISNDISEVEKSYVYIIDAYFHLMDSRRIYAHFVYLIHIPKKETTDQVVAWQEKEPLKYSDIPCNDLLFDLEEEKL